MPLDDLSSYLKLCFEEDKIFEDITTDCLFSSDIYIKANILAKETGVCSGIWISGTIFKKVNQKVKIRYLKKDGQIIKAGDVLMQIQGPAVDILRCERLVLNLFSHLCGVATLTRKYVDKIRETKAKIFDTRKTIPGLRLLEKYAVRCGGGYNHRLDLSDGVLIKDNHLFILSKIKANQTLASLVREVKRKTKGKELQIEVDNVEQFIDALEGYPDIILLDNMSIAEIRKCVAIRKNKKTKVQLEVSGNVNLSNVKEIALTGVDRISIGSLTHSSQSLDLSLEISDVIPKS